MFPAWLALGLALCPSRGADPRAGALHGIRVESQDDAAGGSELDVAEHAFVELRTERDTCLVGEPVRVRIVVGLDADFLAERMIQPFRRELEVPVQLVVPWLDGLPGDSLRAEEGAAPDGRPPGGAETLELALNDGVATVARGADRTIGERRFLVLELGRTLLPERAGELTLPGPVLRLAWTDSFREDPFGRRVAQGRRDAEVRAQPAVLLVRPWPEEGRPPEFGGAVGRFTVRAALDRRQVAVGESFVLRLDVEGPGNLARIAPPRLPPLRGFHVLGVVDQQAPGGRRFAYDLAATDTSPSEIPAIPFTFLDPGPPAAYRTVRTEPLALSVRPAPGGDAARAPRPEDGSEPAPGDGARSRKSWKLVLAIALLGAGAALLLTRRGRRTRP